MIKSGQIHELGARLMVTYGVIGHENALLLLTLIVQGVHDDKISSSSLKRYYISVTYDTTDHENALLLLILTVQCG